MDLYKERTLHLDYYKELVHMRKPDKSLDLQSASWIPRSTDGISLV